MGCIYRQAGCQCCNQKKDESENRSSRISISIFYSYFFVSFFFLMLRIDAIVCINLVQIVQYLPVQIVQKLGSGLLSKACRELCRFAPQTRHFVTKQNFTIGLENLQMTVSTAFPLSNSGQRISIIRREIRGTSPPHYRGSGCPWVYAEAQTNHMCFLNRIRECISGFSILIKRFMFFNIHKMFCF